MSLQFIVKEKTLPVLYPASEPETNFFDTTFNYIEEKSGSS